MNEPLKILLIEDDPDDVELLQVALGDLDVLYEMKLVSDGSMVEPFILNCVETPQVIILDFNLPKLHGKDVLKLLKDNPKFSTIPVVILTTSSNPADIDYSYKLGADKYLIKPTSMEGIKEMVTTIVSLARK
jgi:DNA-binding response OmpR family regulator